MKLSRQEMIRLNRGIKMVFGTSAKQEGYLVLFNALDFRNLKLPTGWMVDAKKGLTDGKAAYPVFIDDVLAAGPKVNINKKTDNVLIHRP